MSSSIRNFLIVRACAIGDFVLNLPALCALSAQNPGAVFTLVGYPETLELARRFIPVHAIHSIERPPWSRLFHGSLPEIAELDFEAAYIWMKEPTFAENLRASGPAVHHGPPFPFSGHAAAHLLRTVSLPTPDLPDLWTPGSKRVILHPGSGSSKKSWPYFRELVAAIPDSAVLIGPCERDLAFPSSVKRLEGLLLTEVAEELLACRHFVGSDSGITHLAAYLGCPTLALFGPTDPAIWGPAGCRCEILWKPSLADISVEEVLERLEI